MALAIPDDLMPEALRRQARPTPNRQAALRMLAIAGVLDGLSRTEGAERRSALARRLGAPSLLPHSDVNERT